jgi:excisionase family DNA binding protein
MEMLTTTQACERLGVSRATLYRLEHRKLIKPERYDNRSVRWPADQLDGLRGTYLPPQEPHQD